MHPSRFFSLPLAESDTKEVEKRLDLLSSLLANSSYDAIYFSEPLFLEYYTGYSLSFGAILSYKKRKPVLFLDGRYYNMVEENQLYTKILIERTLEEALFKHIEEQEYSSCQIAFQGNALSYESAMKLMQGSPIKSSWITNSTLFSEIRRQKSLLEQKAILKSSSLCEEGLLYIIQQLQIGISEEEIAKKLLLYWLEKGAKGPAFDPIIAFGKNSALPHWRASSTRLEEGDIILIDIGVSAYGYASDMTRTFSFGEPKVREFDLWFQATYEALQSVEQIAAPGISCAQIDQTARERLAMFQFESYFTHGLGHGVGLEVHEAPRVSKMSPAHLIEGDVITLEPGIYFPGRGGVRLENSYLVEKKGVVACSQLPFFPRHSEYLKAL